VDTVSNSSSLNKNDRIPGLVVDLFTLACAQERIAGHHLFRRKKTASARVSHHDGWSIVGDGSARTESGGLLNATH